MVAASHSENPSLNVGVPDAGSAVFDDSSFNVPQRFGKSLENEHDRQLKTTRDEGLCAGRRPYMVERSGWREPIEPHNLKSWA